MSVIDLDIEREDRNLKKFHKNFMGDVRDRVTNLEVAIDTAVKQGIFEGFDIGNRIRTNKGNVFKIIAYNLSAVKNNKQKEMAEQIYSRFELGEVEFIKIDDNLYRSQIVVEAVSSSDVMSGTSMLYADMLRKQGFDKLIGPTGIAESFSKGDLPKNIERFIEELVPTDTGVSKIDDFIIAYEGFTDECNEDAYKRIEIGQKGCIDDVYDEVQNEWNTRFIEHGEPVYTGHHYTEENPIMVSVYNRNSKKTIFDSLMDEDIIRDRKIQKAKDLIDKVPSLADILLDPQNSLVDLLLNKPDPRPEGDGDIFEEPGKINENFRPSTFLRVGRNLVELQLGWADKEKNKARSDVFVNGKSIGHYSFEGKSYRVEDNLFETVEEAIAYLIETNAPYALPQSKASDYLKALSNRL